MKSLLDALARVWTNNPVVVAATAASVVVFIAAKVGVVISEQSVVDALLLVVPILLAGVAGRSKVIPVAKQVLDAPPQPDAVDQEG